MGHWIRGIFMGLLALVGLVMASKAVDATFYWVGLLFFVFGVGFIFALIGRADMSGDAGSQEKH